MNLIVSSKDMNLEEEIFSAFPMVLNEPTVTDDFIEDNENIMELEGDVDYFKIVPAYMLWCIRKKDLKLVDMNTVNALAEYGRTKMKDDDYLNFMYRCSPEQKNVVLKFLKWCLTEIITVDKTQIERAMKNWLK